MSYNRHSGMTNEKRDWVQILVAPLLIGVIGVLLTAWYSWQLNQQQNELEKQRAQDAALRAYLDQMSSLLLNKDRPLRQSEEGDEVRILAQARTATVIQRLDADRNRTVIRFLNEAGLTGNGQPSISILAEADLQGAHLEGVDLSSIDLSGTILDDAKLGGAHLERADLSKALLRDADLEYAILPGAELRGAVLERADLLRADLRGANLDDANLTDANLERANLETANLSGTDFSAADLSNADLDIAYLKGATLSNAHLNEASLWNAKLKNAKLSGADLSGTTLRDADLRDARQKAIFRDNFSDKSNGWEVGTDPEPDPNFVEYAEYATGAEPDRNNVGLRVYNPRPGNDMVVTNGTAGSAIKDAIVKVKATVTGKAPESKDTRWGIVCRAADDHDPRYELGLYADGRLTIWKLKDNKWKELDTKSPIPAVRDATTTKTHLRAKCWESKLTIVVNGRSVLQVEDSEIKSGSIGFYVENPGGGDVDILFDDLRVMGHPPHGAPMPDG
jgi:uncharacterized protein YjbI with pentapeptide repeats